MWKKCNSVLTFVHTCIRKYVARIQGKQNYNYKGTQNYTYTNININNDRTIKYAYINNPLSKR